MKKKYIYIYNKTCEECSKEFITQTYSAKICSQSCVSAKNSRLRTKYSDVQIQEIINLRLTGMIHSEIGGKVELPASVVKYILSQNKIKLTSDQQITNRSRRWKDHTPFIDENNLKCCICNVIKNIGLFSTCANNLSGYLNHCKDCDSQKYQDNKEVVKKRVNKYRENNKEKVAQNSSEYYEKNKEKVIARTAEFAMNNPDKTAVYAQKYRQSHKQERNAKTSLRRANKQKATPSWLTNDHIQEINNIYKQCPVGFHIDHIVPIQGVTVCGLHVPWNLVAIPELENEAKSNKLIPDVSNVGMCFQYKRRLLTLADDISNNIPIDLSVSDFILQNERYTQEHRVFIEKYEWLGNTGYNNIKQVFTARNNGVLAGVVIMAEPSAYSKIFAKREALIQRGACSSWAPKNLNSKLIMFSCRWMVKNTEKRVFSGYSDFEAGEIGTIYQACNFSYLGNHFGSVDGFKLPNGKVVGNRYFMKTAILKKFAKELNIEWNPEWLKTNGYKDLKKIPKDILQTLRSYSTEYKLKCEHVKSPTKGKYVLILGKNKTEQYQLRAFYHVVSKPYLKRNI